MTYLIVSQYFWPENFIINDLCSTLSQKGHKVIVLTGQPNYPEGAIFSGFKWWNISKSDYQDGVVIYRIPLWPRGKKSPLGLALNYFSYVFFATFLGPLLLYKERIDSILVFAVSPITQALPAIVLARMKKARVAIWVQDLWPDSLSATGYVKNPFILKQVHRMVKWIYNHVDLLLGQSYGFVQALEAEKCRAKVDYFPNTIKSKTPVTEQPVQSQKLTTLLGQLKKNFSVVFAGNIGEAQSVETIVEAAKILKTQKSPVQIFVVGSGSKLEYLENSKVKFELSNLILPGRFEQNEVAWIYEASNILLLTLSNSPTFDLTVPLRTQSYLAAGKMIVAAVNGESARIIVDSGAGLHGPAEDYQTLSQNLQLAFEMPSMDREEKGKQGKDYFQRHFDMDTQVERLIQLL